MDPFVAVFLVFVVFALIALVITRDMLLFRRPTPVAPPEPEVPAWQPDPAYAQLYEEIARVHADPTDPRHWLLRTPEGTVKSVPVPEPHLEAMLEKWRQEQGQRLPVKWRHRRDRLHMHETSKAWLDERILGEGPTVLGLPSGEVENR